MHYEYSIAKEQAKRSKWKQMAQIASLILFVIATAVADRARAESEKIIKLVEENGVEHIVGKVRFSQENMVGPYSVEWDESKFGDHFLSMRPFKCLEGEAKYWCRVPYPYAINREITSQDVTDLEYDLLFIWKGATEYGINMWNGIYYRLEKADDGKLIGAIHEIDMDKLSAPPEQGNLRPIREVDLEPGEPESHWLPKVVIE